MRHARFFTPLHRELASARLTGFDWLTDDRLVQRTTFDHDAGPVHLIANFDAIPREVNGRTIPARSLRVDGAIVLDERTFVVASE